MSFSFGGNIRVTVFGQSHSEAVGAVIEGLPAGERLDLDGIRTFMRRRVPGAGELTTARREADEFRVLSGLLDGVTCGSCICAVIENSDTRPGDYEQLKRVPRPSHADFPAFVKYGGFNDVRGGGHFSARLTAPLCFAGAAAAQLLERRGVTVAARVRSIAGIDDLGIDFTDPDFDALKAAARHDIPALDENRRELMREAILEAKRCGDSVGGVVECFASGLPAGLGDPPFDGVENRLSAALFGIPAVRGVEFGAGFAAAGMRGSEHNDAYYYADGGRGAVRTLTNNHGGALGGLTSGMPLVLRAAFKPTASIAQKQRSVDLISKTETELQIHGRHDPCVVPRAVPCVEAVAAIVLLDILGTALK